MAENFPDTKEKKKSIWPHVALVGAIALLAFGFTGLDG